MMIQVILFLSKTLNMGVLKRMTSKMTMVTTPLLKRMMVTHVLVVLERMMAIPLLKKMKILLWPIHWMKKWTVSMVHVHVGIVVNASLIKQCINTIMIH